MAADIILEPDLSTMQVQINAEGEICEVDVTNLVIICEPAVEAHIPKGDEAAIKDWKPTAAFNNHLAQLFNEAQILPVRLTPTCAYSLYFESCGRWAKLKKNMSFLPTSVNSTGEESPGPPPKNELD